ncbi:MAG TPA: hypothetical protein VKD67_12140 [Acidimicrobiales bacterium]|nr:hypothetical protein [Acidimicrobiales bacterium]
MTNLRSRGRPGAGALVELLAELGPLAEQVHVLDAISRVDTPVVGDHHGVQAVAKALVERVQASELRATLIRVER